MKRIILITSLIAMAFAGYVSIADYRVDYKVIAAFQKDVVDDAGISYTNAPDAKGFVMVEGYYHVIRTGPIQTNVTHGGVTSSVIAMYATNVTSQSGTIIVWKDAERTVEEGRFTK